MLPGARGLTIRYIPVKKPIDTHDRAAGSILTALRLQKESMRDIPSKQRTSNDK